MDSDWLLVPLVLLLLLGAGRLIGAGQPGWSRTAGLVAAWLVLTSVALGVVFGIVFVVTNVLFFLAGKELAVLGAVLSAVALVVTPVACAVVVRRGIRWLWTER